jgi:hypothetical protein
MKLTVIITAALLLTLPVFAAEKAGEIKVLNGKAELLHENEVIGKRASKGSSLAVNDLLRTKRRGYAEVALVDGSLVKVFEKTRLKINGIERGEGSNADIQKGKVHFDISKISDVSGEFTIRTTTSIIGVKGTSFLVNVMPEFTRVTVSTGTVEVARNDGGAGRVVLNKGESVTVRHADEEMNVTPAPASEMNTEQPQEGDTDMEMAMAGAQTDVMSEMPNEIIDNMNSSVEDADDIYTQPEDRENLVEALTGSARIHIDFER